MSKNKRTRSRGEPDAPDKILRDVSRRHPLELAGAWMNDKPIRSASWAETQFSVRERRMDRLLRVESADEYRFLHVEWSLRLTPKAHRRIFQYHQLGTLTAEIDAQALSTKEKRVVPLPIKSILVVLTGPDKPLPNRGQYATSWPTDEFTGMTYRIEAMYQKTMQEIEAMGDVFWLIFIPLAIDVTRKKLLGILDQLAARTNPDDFVELVAAMSSMAALRKDAPGLLDMIRSYVPKERTMKHWFYKLGRADGKQIGRQKGREEGREEGLALFVKVLTKRLGRELTPAEKKRIGARWLKLGPDKLGDVALDFTPKELEAWLALNGHRKAA